MRERHSTRHTDSEIDDQGKDNARTDASHHARDLEPPCSQLVPRPGRNAKIDIRVERLIRLSEIPRHLPLSASGKRVHISACHRWVTKGVRGLKLESLQLPSGRCTSLEALQRFMERLSALSKTGTAENSRQKTNRQDEIASAMERVARALK